METLLPFLFSAIAKQIILEKNAAIVADDNTNNGEDNHVTRLASSLGLNA